jgi:hypothetical protein
MEKSAPPVFEAVFGDGLTPEKQHSREHPA